MNSHWMIIDSIYQDLNYLFDPYVGLIDQKLYMLLNDLNNYLDTYFENVIRKNDIPYEVTIEATLKGLMFLRRNDSSFDNIKKYINDFCLKEMQKINDQRYQNQNQRTNNFSNSSFGNSFGNNSFSNNSFGNSYFSNKPWWK